jgi:ketosteroid isomerase-like protein
MENVTAAKGLYDAFGRGDIPAVLGGMSPDVRWAEAESNPYMPSGEPWVGPNAVLENLFVKLGADWDGFAVSPKTFHAAGDAVVVEGRYAGTVKATGRSLDAQFCHILEFAGGKLTRFQQYVDTSKLREAMGADGVA